MAIRAWLVGTDRRVFAGTAAPGRARPPRLLAARNETTSLQVAVHNGAAAPGEVSVEAVPPSGWTARVRRVDYVPVRHRNTGTFDDPKDVERGGPIPGFVPDPLFDETTVLLPPGETHAFWVTLSPTPEVEPGHGRVRVVVKVPHGRDRRLSAQLSVSSVELAPRRDFRMTHWFYADAIADWYAVAPFGDAFWPLCRAYMANYAAHGNDTIYVPVFTPPLDGVKRPTQLLHVTRGHGGQYRFDWDAVRRWVTMASSCGITHFEWTHPFTQWGVRHAIRIYEGHGEDEALLWDPETPATGPVYRGFLGQFLPELRAFLQQEGLTERSFFHVSDEPHNDDDRRRYREAREMLRELAPWMQVMDALTDIEYGRKQLTDMPVPSIRTAVSFVNEAIPCWCYYCCGPRGPYLNRLMDTPLAKILMHGFLFYRWPFRGFLHWGYNYWYRSQTRALIDPFRVQDGQRWPNWAYGDTFQVYPGPAGPVDSIRWETFSESLQDYRLLQTLGVDRDGELLKDLVDFDRFPKHSGWRTKARARLLTV